MSDDVAGRLRALAQDCFEGRLTLPAYRRLRAPLLDSLVAHETVTDDADVITQPRMAALRAESSARSPLQQRVRGGRTAAIAAITASVLISLIIGIWLTWNKLPFVRTSGWESPSQAAPEAPRPDSVQTLVQPLLESTDWSDNRLAAVNTGLLEAGRARVAADARTEWFERFAAAVRRRLKEEQALGGASSPDKSPLAALAVTIGVDLKSPDSPILIAAPMTPPPGPAASPGPATGSGAAVSRAAPASVESRVQGRRPFQKDRP
ncbi:MAG: hypothetical protein JWN85_323 [Gammaproteobacteria bacterium]|nr:hypothetical protein [Gammaproteobacteria bacterium]